MALSVTAVYLNGAVCNCGLPEWCRGKLVCQNLMHLVVVPVVGTPQLSHTQVKHFRVKLLVERWICLLVCDNVCVGVCMCARAEVRVCVCVCVCVCV